MAKPILVIRFHMDAPCDDLSIKIGKKMKDYHVFLIPTFDFKDVEFEVYNVDKQPEIDYEALKEFINAKV